MQQIHALAVIVMVDGIILSKIKIKVDDFMKATKKKHISEGDVCGLSASTQSASHSINVDVFFSEF